MKRSVRSGESSEVRSADDGKDQTSHDVQGVIQYNEMAMRNNIGILEYSRTCQAAASGIAAGIVGVTGLWGFAFYLVFALVQSVIWGLKAGGQWSSYFMHKTPLFNHSLLSGLFTYVLFWTFFYGLVHVY